MGANETGEAEGGMKTDGLSEISDANFVLDHFPWQVHHRTSGYRDVPLHSAASRRGKKRGYCGPTFPCSEIGVRSRLRLLASVA